MSLADRSQGPITLPAGHPFLNVQSSWYWSATTVADDTSFAWAVSFSSGTVNNGPNKALLYYVWRVRGGHGYDAY